MGYEQSETTKEITGALVGFHKAVGKIRKDTVNPFFKSKYADLSDILDAVSEPLQENGLVVIQIPEGEDSLVTQVMHVSGEWIRGVSPLAVKERNNPQSLGSAVTYARRYAIGSVLCLNIDQDDDGNAASRTVQPAVQRAAPAPAEQEQPDPFPKSVTVTVTDIEEKMSAKNTPYLRVTTNVGQASVFDQKLFDLIQPGTMRLVLEKKGTYTNVIGVE